MSFQVTTAMIQQYNANIALVSQQKKSRLEGCVRRERLTAEFEYFDQIGPTEAQPKNGRHADTPLMSTPHMRRRVSGTPYNWADLVDTTDKLRMLTDPTSAYTMNAIAAFNRAKDSVIINAAFAAVQAGKTGTESTITFPTAVSNNIYDAASFGADETTVLTVDKLLRAKKAMWRSEVDEGIPLYCCVSASQLTDLLNATEVKSADYNTVKALAQGDIDTFMGFKFIRSERLPWDGKTRQCIAWAQDGLLLATQEEITVKVSERDDKNYSTQIYVEMDLGAVRMEEAKVMRIFCKEVA